jgi:YVTN family beta-propeller protein
MPHTHSPKRTKLTSIFILLTGLLPFLAGCFGGGGGGTTPPPAPTTPVARFAYVANSNDDTVSIFIADNTTGQLRHHGYVLTGDGPSSLTIDPSGQFAYTLNSNSQDISLFTIDSLAGDLIAADCNQNTANLDSCNTGTGATPVSMVFEPNGRFAYVANQLSNTITAHAKDSSTGALNDVVAQPPVDVTSQGGDTPEQLRVHPDGGFLYVVYDATDNVGVYEISATDGTLTQVTGSPVASGGTAAADIAITPDGQYAYVANRSGEIGVFTIDGSGLLVANGSPLMAGGAPTPEALAIESSGRWLYMLSQEVSGSVSLFEIQNDGTLVQSNCGTSQTCTAGSVPESIAIDPTGQFVSVTNGGGDTLSLYSIDQNTGQLTALSGLAGRDRPSAVTYYTDTDEVTVTPRFAYVANFDGVSLSSYTINASNGTLTALGTPVATAGKPTSVTVDISGSYLYATNEVTDNVSVFSINSSSGTLTEIAGSPFSIETNPTGPETGPQSIIIDPSRRFAYVANSTDTLSAYSINSSTGALTLLSGSPFATGDNPSSVTVDPTGRFLYNTNINTDDVSVFTIDTGTGALTAVGAVAAEDAPNSIVADPSGRFVYVANVGTSAYNISAYSIDPQTGALAEIPGSPFPAGSAPFSITVDPLGEFVYVANQSSQNVTPYTINQTTGALTAGTSVLTDVRPQSITVDPSGQYVYVANNGSNSVSGYVIDSSTGALTRNGASVATGASPRSIVTTGAVQ